MIEERSPKLSPEQCFLGKTEPSVNLDAAYQAHISELQLYLSNFNAQPSVESSELQLKLAQVKAEYSEWKNQSKLNSSESISELT